MELRCRLGQVVTQLQQEVFALRAQVAAESGLAEAARAINNLTTAQIRKETPSLIDVKDLGRPKEFSGKKEDFQQWSKETEAFFAGVIQECEMMLECAAEQTIDITMTSINLEFLPSDTNLDKEAKPSAYDHFSWKVEVQNGIERWESYVSRCENKLKDKLDDEIKLARLEALVPEELEKHLMLNSNRLRTFEDARLEIVTYVEAKFGLRIRDSKPGDTGARCQVHVMGV